MNPSMNKVMFIGNLRQDPEIRYMPNGKAVANLTLATSESWKDEAGALQERTEWHRLVMYNRLAEIAGEYLRKGSQIFVEGKLRTRKWQDQQGQDRYTTEVVVEEMKMLGSNNHNSGHNTANVKNTPAPKSPSNQPSNQPAQPYQKMPNSQGQPNSSNQPFKQGSNGFSEPDFDFDDDGGV